MIGASSATAAVHIKNRGVATHQQNSCTAYQAIIQAPRCHFLKPVGSHTGWRNQKCGVNLSMLNTIGGSFKILYSWSCRFRYVDSPVTHVHRNGAPACHARRTPCSGDWPAGALQRNGTKEIHHSISKYFPGRGRVHPTFAVTETIS